MRNRLLSIILSAAMALFFIAPAVFAGRDEGFWPPGPIVVKPDGAGGGIIDGNLAIGGTMRLNQYTVATLPASPTTGDRAEVTDGDDATDCTTGGGTDIVTCRYNGAAWVNAGDGQAAGSAEVSAAAIGAAGENDTTHAYSKDDIFDYVVQHDPDYDGLPDGVEADVVTIAMLADSEFSANVKAILGAANYAAIGDLLWSDLEAGDIPDLSGAAWFTGALPTASSLSVDDLITLSGVAGGVQNLGEFTGSTINDNVTIKAALQALETAVEGVSGDDLGSAAYTDVVALWASGSCSGYLKSDGTCDTPSGGGDVSKVGTPADHEWGVWTGDGTIAGVAVTASKVVCTDADGEPVACTNVEDVNYAETSGFSESIPFLDDDETGSFTFLVALSDARVLTVPDRSFTLDNITTNSTSNLTGILTGDGSNVGVTLPAANVLTFLATPSVANLASALSDDGAFFATLAGYADAAAVASGIGVGTEDSPQLTGIELSHASENTLTASGGVLSIEGSALAFNAEVPGLTISAPVPIFSLNVKDITDAVDDVKKVYTRAMTLTGVYGICVGGTNVIGTLSEVDSDGDDADAVVIDSAWTITTTAFSDTSFTNSAIDAGDWLQWDTTSVSGSVTQFTLIAYGYET